MERHLEDLFESPLELYEDADQSMDVLEKELGRLEKKAIQGFIEE
jgi:hypothetical protein